MLALPFLVCNLICTFILVICQSVAFSRLVPFRIGQEEGAAYVVVASVGVYCLYLYLVWRFGFATTSKYQLFLFTIPVFLLVFLLAKHRNGKTIFLFYFANFMIDSCDTLGFLLVFSLGLQRYEWLHFCLRSGLVILCTVLLICWIFPTLKNIYQTRSSIWIPITASTIISALFLYYIAVFPIPLGKRPEDFPLTAFATLTVAINYMIVILSVFDRTMLDKREMQVSLLETELSTSHMLLQQNERQYETTLETYDMIRRMRHDMHHYLMLIEGLNSQGKAAEIQAYIQKLSSTIPDVQTLHYCNSFETNLIFAHYSELCISERIRFSCEMHTGNIEFHQPVKFCVFIGNALENALEACRKMASSTNRFIEIKGTAEKEAIILKISNSYGGTLPIDADGAYVSSKLDKGQHGFGLRNMKQIAIESDGWCEIEHTETVFIVQALLRV